MATAAMSLIHLTRIPRHVSLFPYLRPHRSSSSSLNSTRTCKPRVSSTIFLHVESSNCFHLTRKQGGPPPTSLIIFLTQVYTQLQATCQFHLLPPHHQNNVATDDETYDVIVVGGGHAGCEAALTSAHLGADTLLLTLNIHRITWQPCDPAVGGPAKSQLVHEVDALGGDIGKMADRCYLQKRVLNIFRGPAVRASHAQTDKREYAIEMRQILERKVRVGRTFMPAGRAGESASDGLTENL